MNRSAALLILIFSICFSSLLSGGSFVLKDTANRKIRRGGKYDSRAVYIARNVRAPQGEFRGVWISTVLNLDFKKVRSAAEFKRQYLNMIRRISNAGFNAVIFQVRPNCDAFYPSRYAPYSRWLCGREGMGLKNFDPLAYMIKTAHAHKLEFHAWLNPYRVMNDIPGSKSALLRSCHPASFARRNPHLVLEFHNGKSRSLFLDPGRPEVISHMRNVVFELCMRYNIDAIHFDDYFYPYEEIGGLDNRSFARYNPLKLKKADWRRRNTETLIFNIRQVINAANAKRRTRIKFGISPFGIWGNAKDLRGGSATGGKQTYINLYADTRRWVKRGYLDYIVPQIYWNFAHETAAYAALVDWWSNTVKDTRTRLYIGMAPYRSGASGWHQYELRNQLRYNRMHPEVSGMILFSYRHLFGAKIDRGVRNFLTEMRGYVPPARRR